jgi:hypothetical protein
MNVLHRDVLVSAGQIAAATENSIAEPAPSTAETRAGSSLFRCSEEPQHNVKGWSAQHEITADKSFGARGNAPQQNALLFDHRGSAMSGGGGKLMICGLGQGKCNNVTFVSVLWSNGPDEPTLAR